MNNVIHIGNMTLSKMETKPLWLFSDDKKDGIHLTRDQHAELEELLKDFFDKHF